MTIILQKSGIVKYYEDFSVGRNWKLCGRRFTPNRSTNHEIPWHRSLHREIVNTFIKILLKSEFLQFFRYILLF